jgi:hypothetical protein
VGTTSLARRSTGRSSAARGPLGNVLQMTVKQALAMDADVKVAISDRP